MSTIYGEDEVGALTEIRDSPPSDYLLKIKSFSLFPENTFDKIKSSNFEAGGHQWRILVFPDGHKEGYGDHISVYLSVANKKSLADGKEVHTIFKFFLFDQIRGKYPTVQGNVRRFDSAKYKWGLSKFISLQEFQDPTKGFLVDDICFLGAEVYVIRSSGHAFRNSGVQECLSISNIEDVVYNCSWKATGFSELVDDECFPDEFDVGNYKWQLCLFPSGDSDNRGCSLSVFLELTDPPIDSSAEHVKAEFRITLNDQINKKRHPMVRSFNFGFMGFWLFHSTKGSKRQD